MKPTIIVAATLLVIAASQCEARVLDVSTRAAMQRHVRAASVPPSRSGDDDDASTYDDMTHWPLVVKLANENGLDDLLSAGAIIWHRRDNLVLCAVPVESIDLIDHSDNLICASIGPQLTADLDVARQTANAEPLGSTLGYTGKGVVAGFTDIGFDPAHIAFRDSDGNPRTSRFVAYRETHAQRSDITDVTLSTPTDTTGYYHATHVAGILAGSYSGNPYHGIATDAEIVATTSQLYSAGILAGIDDIINHAAAQGKPAVINMSLSSSLGPRDGSTLYNQYLALQGREAVICISAGNSGNGYYTLNKTLPNDGSDLTLSSRISTWDYLNPAGDIDIWASDGREFTVQLSVWDGDLKCNVGELSVDIGSNSLTDVVITTTPDQLDEDDDPDYTIIDWAPLSNGEIFQGYISLYSETDSENGRRRMRLSFDFSTEIYSDNGQWGRYSIGFTVNGHPGQRIDVYTDSSIMLRSAGDGLYLDGNGEMSINDLACSPNVISVGMWASRNSYPLADGTTYTSTNNVGIVSQNSSYGTTPAGQALPLVVAPGQVVVSARSSQYDAETYGNPAATVCTATDTNGHSYEWMALGGTSMASPFAAGVAAAMLEANPALTGNEIAAIMRMTVQSVTDIDNPRYGSSGGLINAAAAVAEATRWTTLDTVENQWGLSATLLSGNQLKIAASTGEAHLCIYSVTGTLLLNTNVTHNSLINLSTLPCGIALIRLTDRNGHTFATKGVLR